MKAFVTITLDVPDEFNGMGPWGKEESLHSFISHWLEEGYYANNNIVSLPEGIEYEGFELKMGQASEQ